MRAYERFLWDAGKPIGTTASIIMIVLFALWALGTVCGAMAGSPSEQAWEQECKQIGITNEVGSSTKGISGDKVCMSWEITVLGQEENFTKRCADLEGTTDTKYVDGYNTCVRLTQVTELGKKSEYTPTR